MTVTPEDAATKAETAAVTDVAASAHRPPAPPLSDGQGVDLSTGARKLDVDTLIEVERAAADVVEPIVDLWRKLANAADTAVSSNSLEEVLRNALATMSRVLAANTVAVLLANEAGDELHTRAAIGLSEELTLGLGIKAGQGMAGRVLSTRRPLVVGDLSSIDVVNPVLRQSGLRSVAAVPLLCEDHILGVLYAASYEQDRFTSADADLLLLLGDRLAAALDRVRLFERERSSRRQAERLADRVSRMQRITAILATVGTAHEAAGALVESLRPGPQSWVSVWLLEEGRLVPVRHGPGLPPDGWTGPMPLDSALPVAAAVREERPTFHSGPGSAYAVLPIISRDQCVGAVAVVFEGAHDFPADERELLSAIVSQAAQALDRVRLAAAQRQMADRANFFARAGRVLAAAEDLTSTLERLGDLAVGVLGEICLIDVIGEDGELVRMVATHRDRSFQHLVDRLHHEFPPDPNGAHPAVAAIRTGRTRWSDNMPDEFLRQTTVSTEHFALVKALGFRSYLTVPLIAEDRVLGSVTSVSSSRAFRQDDITFAEELAGQVAVVVDNARRYDVAYRTSQILQSSLLPPELPALDGVKVATRYLTANRGLEVGGDFYDCIVLPSGQALFVIGDVAGHDRWAAAQMGHLRSALRALAGQVCSPGELIAALRWSWELLGFDRIATALVVALDPGARSITLASAGHYPPLLVDHATASFVPVRPNPPLGMPAAPPQELRHPLEPGQVLLLYTDGAIDERLAGSERSMGRLARAAGGGDLDPDAVCERVVDMLDPHRPDDVAIMALAVEPDTAF